MDTTMWDKTKWACSGLAVGAMGFWAFLGYLGWMSADSAQALAQQQAHDTLVTYASAECVDRFKEQQPAAILVNWRALQVGENGPDSYQFDPVKFFTKDAGADLLALPDQKLPDADRTDVANSCAQAVLALTKIGQVDLTAPAKKT